MDRRLGQLRVPPSAGATTVASRRRRRRKYRIGTFEFGPYPPPARGAAWKRWRSSPESGKVGADFYVVLSLITLIVMMLAVLPYRA